MAEEKNEFTGQEAIRARARANAGDGTDKQVRDGARAGEG